MFQARPQRSEENGEEHDARHEDQAAPVPVGERARGEDQRGKAERIGVDDPLQAGQAGVEALLHVRQRDDHDRDVEEQHERRQADGEERPLPRAAVAVCSIPRTLQKPAAKTDGRCRAPSEFERLDHTGEMLSSRARAFAEDTMLPFCAYKEAACSSAVPASSRRSARWSTSARLISASAWEWRKSLCRRELDRFARESLGRLELATVREDLRPRRAPDDVGVDVVRATSTAPPRADSCFGLVVASLHVRALSEACRDGEVALSPILLSPSYTGRSSARPRRDRSPRQIEREQTGKSQIAVAELRRRRSPARRAVSASGLVPAFPRCTRGPMRM